MIKKILLLCLGAFVAPHVGAECKIVDADLAQGQYQGACKDGWAHGYGEVTGAIRYQGDFLNGKKHGKGVKSFANGDVYAGEFVDDYRHGKGRYVWGKQTQWAGDSYEGDYQRDLRHGWGIFQWHSGDRYEGPWENDLRMVWSPMEMRRHMANQAYAKAMQIGVQVCSSAVLGLAYRQQLRGQIETVAPPNMQIRLSFVEGNSASLKGAVVKSGDVISDEMLNWQLCATN